MKKTLTALLILLLFIPLTGFSITADDFVVSDDVDDMDKYYFYARLLMSDMTLEEKVAQLFIVSPQQLADGAEATSVNPQMDSSIRKCTVGGVMLRGENMVSGQQLKTLSEEMQRAAMLDKGIPLFIAAEEEGGQVERIALKLGLEDTPSLGELSRIGYEEDAYFHGEMLAERLLEYGFNMNFAPVGDVRDNLTDDAIKDRYAGSDASHTAKITTLIAKGMQDHGIIAVMKHFPGESDGDECIKVSYDDLISKNLLPFREAIDQGMGMIMVSSLPVLSVDDGEPAMFSDTVCETLLRDELGFEGVIVTDKLSELPASVQYGSSDAAVNAMMAGCDMLLLPEDYEQAHAAVMKAVENGQISEERIDQSVVRILALKIISGMIK